ncbi:MAG: PDZ domain-containing protein [Gemmatimonadetes bacterium]|nr:PDZ domain-containing protein [Gemmatimonadota bacterium]
MYRPRLTFLVAALTLAAAPALRAQSRAEARSGWLGFSFGPRVLVLSGGREAPVVVERVAEGSPAQRAGLQVGDTIARLNGLTATPRLVNGIAAGLQAGDTIRLDVRRAGQTRALVLVAEPRPAAYRSPGRGAIVIDGDSVVRTMRVYLDSARVYLDSALHLPRIVIEHRDSGTVYLEGPRGRVRVLPRLDRDTFKIRVPDVRIWVDSACEGCRMFDLDGRRDFVFAPFDLGRRAVAGAELAEIEPPLTAYFQVDDGVLVLRVAPGTPAAKAGLEPGDVIVRAAGTPVHSIAELRRRLREDVNQHSELEIVRKGKSRTVRLPSE